MSFSCFKQPTSERIRSSAKTIPKKSSVIKFVNSLELFGIGYSWGGFESLAILQELRSNKKDEYLQGRKYFRFNKDEHIVRLHIGLEDPKDLINDLKRSLRYIK